MAGILDFLQTPEAQMGIGLLAAGGPSTTPMNVGQRVQMAMQGMTAQQQNALKMKLLQSQVDENASQVQLRQAQAARANALADAPNSLFGWGGSPQPGAASGGVPANMGAGVQPGSLKGVPLAAITRYKMMGGQDLTKQWELENIGTAQQPGWVVKADGSREFLGDPSKGLTVGPDGVTNVMRGAPEAQAALVRPTERAKAEEGARFQEGTPTLDADGRKVVRSRLDMFGGSQSAQMPTDPLLRAIVTTESGGNPNAVSPKGARGLMQVMPGTNAAPGFGVAPAKDGTEAERTRVGQEYWKAMNERYQNPTLAAIAYNWGPGNADAWLASGGDFKKLPPETQSYVAQVMTRGAVNARQPSGNVVELSPTEQAQNKANEARMVDTAKADVVRDTGKTAEGKRAGQVSQISNLASQLLDQGPTASGVGSLVDAAANFVGQPLKGGTKAQQLEALSGWLVSNVPRMEGPQSNADVLNYQTMAGRVGDRTLPVEARKAALGTLMELQRKYAEAGSDTTAPNPIKPSKVLDALPTPNASNRGQRIRDTTTGKVLVSNGLQWKEE